MRTPKFDMAIFKERRQKLAQLLKKGSAVVITAKPEFERNHDVSHPYRADSNLFYLTGFEEPESALVYRPGLHPETVLFVREKNVELETWTGFRYGPELTKELYQVDEAYPMTAFSEIAPQLLKEVDHLYYQLFDHHEFDTLMRKAIADVKVIHSRSGRGNLPISDSYSLVGEMRVHKSEYELSVMREAAKISCEAHVEVMKWIRPGVNERALQGKFAFEALKRGAQREGYQSILAGGANATTLHYVFNDQPVQDGDLFLIDAGAEVDYYTADITRTYPVNGRFTPVQHRIYQQVLTIQKEVIANVRPGVTKKELQDQAIDGLVSLMLEEKMFTESRQTIIDEQLYRRYYMHGIGHYLGMDVHDAGRSQMNGEDRPLEPGMVYTIEPGIYIPYDDERVSEELRGIGIRIEDNIVVTESGYENLTISAPKEIKDLEEIIGTHASM